ncbi:MAG: cyclodeaminase/cyclohydrolase family protein, partial [Muribaculaceae bacterium]|nr:cyclodeaminase/cyclohydrolase family protein [Muribaculaceae bacterium]
NRIMAALQMPKSTPEEKAARAQALEDATLYATEVPLRTMETTLEVFPLLESMAATGNPNSVSDAGVGALAGRSAVLGAQLNVKINAAGLKDREKAKELTDKAEEIARKAIEAEGKILSLVNAKIG